MNYLPVVPAIIPASQAEVEKYAQVLAFSPELQLDLVDGQFTPTVSWPYLPGGDPLSVKSFLDSYTLEVDLMVAEPLTAAMKWIEAGADMIVFHVETLSLDAFRHFADNTNVSIGASAHGDTSLDTLCSYIEHADYIQLMGIREIGAQGQPFDEGVLGKISELKKRFPKKSISIDGSVNQDTITRLRQAGADRFICGSAIVLQSNPEVAQKALSALVNG